MTKPKPTIVEMIYIDGINTGAIMLDDKGYFYRPKKTKIGRAFHNANWDGGHFQSVAELKQTLY